MRQLVIIAIYLICAFGVVYLVPGIGRIFGNQPWVAPIFILIFIWPAIFRKKKK